MSSPCPDISLPVDVPADDFARAVQRTTAWITAYTGGAAVDHPVLAAVKPGELRDALPGAGPAGPDTLDAVLDDFERLIVPGLTHWNSPRFFAYFPASAALPGVLAEYLAAAINQNAMLWRTSPAATELEEVCTGWLAGMLGLDTAWRGVILDTASTSTLTALAAAREAAGVNVRERGLAEAASLTVYCSAEAHSSVEKAVMLLGLGTDNLRRIATDADLALDPAELRLAIASDVVAGRTPCAVVATVGTTSSTAIDPVPAIADACAEHGLWLHVDAAYGGNGAVAPSRRFVLSGIERADSLVVNPHKWLFVPLDLSVLFFRRPEAIASALSLTPEYLRAEDGVTNLMDYGHPLGRRFRALKLWFTLRVLGTDAVADRIEAHCRMARWLAAEVDADPHFERLAPVPFSTVCLRFRPPGESDEATLEDLNASLLERVNAAGDIFISHTKLRGRYVLRVAIGSFRTRGTDVEAAWRTIRASAAALA